MLGGAWNKLDSIWELYFVYSLNRALHWQIQSNKLSEVVSLTLL